MTTRGTEPTGPAAAPSPAAAIEAALLIRPGGWRIRLAPGQTLLLAALAHGVRLPHSCRNGTCRACLCRLAEGAVRYTVEWPGLLAEEKAEGWILPCVAVAAEGPAAKANGVAAQLVIDAPGAMPWP